MSEMQKDNTDTPRPARKARDASVQFKGSQDAPDINDPRLTRSKGRHSN